MDVTVAAVMWNWYKRGQNQVYAGVQYKELLFRERKYDTDTQIVCNQSQDTQSRCNNHSKYLKEVKYKITLTYARTPQTMDSPPASDCKSIWLKPILAFTLSQIPVEPLSLITLPFSWGHVTHPSPPHVFLDTTACKPQQSSAHIPPSNLLLFDSR